MSDDLASQRHGFSHLNRRFLDFLLENRREAFANDARLLRMVFHVEKTGRDRSRPFRSRRHAPMVSVESVRPKFIRREISRGVGYFPSFLDLTNGFQRLDGLIGGDAVPLAQSQRQLMIANRDKECVEARCVIGSPSVSGFVLARIFQSESGSGARQSLPRVGSARDDRSLWRNEV